MKIDKNLINVSGVYCIENIINNKKYVGSSKNIYFRLNKHKSDLIRNKHDNSHLQNAVNKYGIKNFNCFILKEADKNSMIKLEQDFINSKDFQYNKNLSASTTILDNISRLKISETLKKGYKEGKIKLTRTTPVEVFSLEGNYIFTYPTIVDASRCLKISVTKIQLVLRNSQKQTHGLQFRKVGETKKILNLKLNSAGNSRIKKIKEKQLDKRKKSCELINIINDERLIFESVEKCANFLNCKAKHIYKSINLYNKPYKKIYMIRYIASL